MAITNIIPYNFGVSALTGGSSSIGGQGPKYQVAFTGNWAVGDGYSFNFILAGQMFTLGQGILTGVVPTVATTIAERVHFVAGSYWYGSDNGDATAWEQQAPGAFAVDVANQTFATENLLGLSSFQGRMMTYSFLMESGCESYKHRSATNPSERWNGLFCGAVSRRF